MAVRYVLRCHMAGTIGDAEIIGPGAVPGTIEVRGRHAHSWSGALNAAALATVGPTDGRIASEAVMSVQCTDIVQAVVMTDAAISAWQAITAMDRP